MQKKNIYKKKEGYYFWPGLRFLGFFFIGFPVVNIFNNGVVFYGAEFIIAGMGLLLVLTTIGYQIDFKNKLHREYVSFGNYYYGKWTSISEPDYVTVFVENVVETGGTLSVRYHARYPMMRVRIISKSQMRYDIGTFPKKKRLLKLAECVPQN